MMTRDHPKAVARWQLARATGAAAEIAYPGAKDARGRPVYALTMLIDGQIVSFQGCRFGDPFGTLRRVDSLRGRYTARDAARNLHDAMTSGGAR